MSLAHQYLGEENSGQRGQQVQRPRAGSMLMYSRGTRRLEESSWDEIWDSYRGKSPRALGGRQGAQELTLGGDRSYPKILG